MVTSKIRTEFYVRFVEILYLIFWSLRRGKFVVFCQNASEIISLFHEYTSW